MLPSVSRLSKQCEILNISQLYRSLWSAMEIDLLVGTVSPQLMLGCGWYAPLLTRSVNTRLGLCGARGGALDVGAVSPLVAEAAGDLWLMSADGAAMAERVAVEVG
jgi:hypothetical protein